MILNDTIHNAYTPQVLALRNVELKRGYWFSKKKKASFMNLTSHKQIYWTEAAQTRRLHSSSSCACRDDSIDPRIAVRLKSLELS